MKTKSTKMEPLHFKKFKTYSAAEIVAAGGTTAFGKMTNFDPKKLYHLGGEPLSEMEFKAALKDLERK